jgi:hypothetical protein
VSRGAAGGALRAVVPRGVMAPDLEAANRGREQGGLLRQRWAVSCSVLRCRHDTSSACTHRGHQPFVRQSEMRYLAKPFSPSPAGSIFTAFKSPTWSFARGPVSKITVVPASGANDQLASADGLMVFWSMM